MVYMHAIKAAPAPLRETRLFFSFLVGFYRFFFLCWYQCARW